jgi:diguanylate cyclase (GGDEF)-like protein/PAS domain S-box-containing protein
MTGKDGSQVEGSAGPADQGTNAPVGEVDYQSFTAGSADVNTVATSDGIYRYVSAACLRLFGWDPAELEGHNQEEFIHPNDIPSLHAGRDQLAAGRVTTNSFRFRRRDGSYLWTEATSRHVKADGHDLVVSTLRDIEQRRRSDVTLLRRAFTDPLTGVANRTVLMDRLQQAVRRLSRESGILAVFYLDLDRFKVINDSLGHRIGDTVLSKMAERLTRHLRPADTLARLGGDEFVVLAEAVESERAVIELGHRLVEAGREPFEFGDEKYICTLSVGIAWATDSGRGADDLLQEADLTLSSQGRGTRPG